MICATCALAGDGLARKIAGHLDHKPTETDLKVARTWHTKCVGRGCSCQHRVEGSRAA